MVKPLWVKVIGKVALTAFLVALAMHVKGTLSGYTDQEAAVGVAFYLFAAFLGLFWLLGTLLHRSRVSRLAAFRK